MLMKLSGKKTDKNNMTYQESLDSGEYARAFALVYSAIMNMPEDNLDIMKIRLYSDMISEVFDKWGKATPNDANFTRGYIMFKGHNISREEFLDLKKLAETQTPVDKELADWFVRGVDVVFENEF